MRMFDVIKKKRDGYELSTSEINYFIQGYVNGEIPDYQVSALLMAIYFNGMTVRETVDLTFAMRDSGKTLSFNGVDGIRVDKHSTGGVGDKTSLIVAPIVACFGVKVAKMSGRGLGHTGGTIDKLESIRNFNVNLDQDTFKKIVNEVGVSIISQNQDLAPADKKLYALRDVTATIDSIPLVVSSIMSKKLCSDDDCIVLDVKCGSGAFCKTLEESKRLAKLMVDIGKKAGKKTIALITDMNRPLGNAIGNFLEVKEAVRVLKGEYVEDLTEICVELSSHMLNLAGHGNFEKCKADVKEVLQNGKAYQVFLQMVEKQGGDITCLEEENNAKYTYLVKATKQGYIQKVDTEKYGLASLSLGAGRNVKEDKIDYFAGIVVNKKVGDFVEKGEQIALLYANDQTLFTKANQTILDATIISQEKTAKSPLVLDIVN